MPVWWKPLIAAVAAVGAAVWHTQRDRVNLQLMQFFRDVGRYKALQRRRRDDADRGLLAFLARHDDPLHDLLDLDAAAREDELHLDTYTLSELWEYGNHDSGTTLLLAILGRVYDVSAGDKFYGPAGRYGGLAGHDVTYALATGCNTAACIDTDWTALPSESSSTSSSDGADASLVFTDAQLSEAKKWLSFFHLHDKYKLVGKLEGDSFDALVQQLLSEHDDEETVTESERMGQEEDSANSAADDTTTSAADNNNNNGSS